MRADRLISIILHLQQRRMTAKELSQLLEVSERTIYRDIDALSAAGIPIHADSGSGGGFTLASEYRTKVDGLNTSEIHALFLQMNNQPFQQLGINQSIKSALLKIYHSLSDQLRVDAEWIRNRVFLDTGSWRAQPEHAEMVKIVQKAVWEQQRARMVYANRSNVTYELVIDAHGLVMKAGMWFVVGRGEGVMNAFRLSRISFFELLGERFEREEGFELEAYWLTWIAEYERRQAQYRMWVEVDEEALPRLSRMNGTIMGKRAGRGVEHGKKGWVEAQLSFENEDAAFSAILSLTGQIHVISPIQLRERICEQASRLLAEYSVP